MALFRAPGREPSDALVVGIGTASLAAPLVPPHERDAERSTHASAARPHTVASTEEMALGSVGTEARGGPDWNPKPLNSSSCAVSKRQRRALIPEAAIRGRSGIVPWWPCSPTLACASAK